MSDDFQAELRFLGITSSPAFVRAPEGNGVAERFIRTLKEQLLWVRTFHTVEDLRRASTTGCVSIMNSGWLSGISFAHRLRHGGTCWPRRRPREDVDGRNSKASCGVVPKIQRTQWG